MKIAVYAICKNESKFVNQWLESMSEADYICVLDTGSTDNTYELFQKKQQEDRYKNKLLIKQQVIKPWRFDVARNESMKLIPSDATFCICTDLDELLIEGWAKDFRQVYENNPNLDQCYYKYSWSHTLDGKPGRVFWYDKCHKNDGNWYWKYSVHEILTSREEENHLRKLNYIYLNGNKIYLHHWPDQSKSRGSYLSLLEQRFKENPEDFYGRIYLAHEYFYRGYYQKCIDFIHQNVLTAYNENSFKDDMLCKPDIYMFLGDSYSKLKQFDKAEENYKLGIESAPTFRENYMCLGQLYNDEQRYDEAIEIVNKALRNTKRCYSWLEKDISWTYQPFDLLSIAYFYLGKREVSLQYSYLAYMLDTNNKRLEDNYYLIKRLMEV